MMILQERLVGWGQCKDDVLCELCVDGVLIVVELVECISLLWFIIILLLCELEEDGWVFSEVGGYGVFGWFVIVWVLVSCVGIVIGVDVLVDLMLIVVFMFYGRVFEVRID